MTDEYRQESNFPCLGSWFAQEAQCRLHQPAYEKPKGVLMFDLLDWPDHSPMARHVRDINVPAVICGACQGTEAVHAGRLHCGPSQNR